MSQYAEGPCSIAELPVPDSESDTVEMGELFGKYELLERIATGGMAEIFRASSISVGGFRKEVALKRILPHLSTDAEFVNLFISEAKLAVTLNHSNLVQVFDFGRVSNNYFLAMELVDGKDMTQILIKQSRRRRTVPLEVACYIISETMLGLEYAHTRLGPDGQPLSIVHRDVSPHNVLVSYDGQVKITDFGIAKARTRVSLSRPGMILGKFAYMSPEQARGDEVTPASDVYSAGVTLYETLTGRRLFYSDDPGRTLSKVRNPNIQPPSHYNPEIPPALDAIVMKALAPSAVQRYGSARSLANELQAFLHDLVETFNDSHLARFMKDLFADEVGTARFLMAADRPAPISRRISIQAVEGPSLDDPILTSLAEKLSSEPNLWTLAEVGDRLEANGEKDDALRVWRAAAIKFAQNGLLVQAASLYVKIREVSGWSDALGAEISRLQGFAGKANAEILNRLGNLGDDAIGQLLGRVFSAAEPSGMAMVLTSPVFSLLGPDELARLLAILRLKRVAPGTQIIEEGEPGQSLYIIARGRVVIYCRNFQGNKVYLSSLSDGDCVGEFSFFTRERRAATVETLDEVLLFEIGHHDFDRIVGEFPNLTGALLQFYKERIVATLLAKSELFGVLAAKVRDALAARLSVEAFERDAVIITEGDTSDGFYVIKSGEVEVYSERGGSFVFLSKLKSGDFFGESAAIMGEPRSASVRALGPCEILRLSGSDFAELAQSNPELLAILHSRIAFREAETARRLTAGGLLI